MKKNDIVCATESWRDRYDPDILAWDDEFTEHSCLAKRDTKSGRSSRATSLFIKNQTSRFGSIEKQDSYHVWYKLDKKLFPTLNKSVYICFSIFLLVLLGGLNQAIHTILKNL